MPLITNVQGSPWRIIAFVNMNSWYESYKGMADSRFLLVDSEGTTLYESARMLNPCHCRNGTANRNG